MAATMTYEAFNHLAMELTSGPAGFAAVSHFALHPISYKQLGEDLGQSEENFRNWRWKGIRVVESFEVEVGWLTVAAREGFIERGLAGEPEKWVR